MDVVRIFDTTLRDGEQSPGFSMKTDEKIRMARQLAKLGVDTIEAGFPISSRGDLEAVQAVAREVRDVPVAALARAKKHGYRRSCRSAETGGFLPFAHFSGDFRPAPSGQAAHDPRTGAGSHRHDDSLRPAARRRSGILRRRRGPHRHRLSLPGLQDRGRSRRNHFEFAGYRRLCGSGRVRRDVSSGCANSWATLRVSP